MDSIRSTAGKAVDKVVDKVFHRPSPLGRESSLYATGTVRVLLTQNIGRRYFENSRCGRETYEEFRGLRGTPELAQAIRDLGKSFPYEDEYGVTQPAPSNASDTASGNATKSSFVVDGAWRVQEETGYELDVLTQYFMEYESMPIYELKEQSDIEDAVTVLFDTDTQHDYEKEGDNQFREDVDKLNPTRMLWNEWRNWKKKKLMLSRYGVFQVTLEYELGQRQKTEDKGLQPEKLGDVLDILLGLEQELDLDRMLDMRNYAGLRRKPNTLLEPSIQWEMVRILTSKFVEAIGYKLPLIYRKEDSPLSVIFDKDPKRIREAFTSGISYPSRFRYVVFDFHGFYRQHKKLHDTEYVPIPIDELTHEDRREIACLLEGVPILNMSGQIQPSPIRQEDKPTSKVDHLLMAPIKVGWKSAEPFATDTSTWWEDLCLFTTDNALICRGHASDQVSLGLAFPRQEDMPPEPSAAGTGSSTFPPQYPRFRRFQRGYSRYWESVIRGVSYMCELRTVAKILHNSTSDDLEDITSRYMRPVELDQAHIDKLARDLRASIEKVSSSARLLARLRNASRPTTLGTADYAVTKYRGLREALRMDQLIEHIDQNIRLTNSILGHSENRLSEGEAKRTGNVTMVLTFVLSIVTVVLPLLAFPPFIEVLIPQSEPKPRIRDIVWEVITFNVPPQHLVSAIILIGGLIGVSIAFLIGSAAVIGNREPVFYLAWKSVLTRRVTRVWRRRGLFRGWAWWDSAMQWRPRWRLIENDDVMPHDETIEGVYAFFFSQNSASLQKLPAGYRDRIWQVDSCEDYKDTVGRITKSLLGSQAKNPFMPVLWWARHGFFENPERDVRILIKDRTRGLGSTYVVIGYIELESEEVNLMQQTQGAALEIPKYFRYKGAPYEFHEWESWAIADIIRRVYREHHSEHKQGSR